MSREPASVTTLRGVLRNVGNVNTDSNQIEDAVQSAVRDLFGSDARGILNNSTAAARLATLGTVNLFRPWMQGASEADFLIAAIQDDDLILVLAAGLVGRPFAYPLLYIRNRIQDREWAHDGDVLSTTDIVTFVNEFHKRFNAIDQKIVRSFLSDLYTFDRPTDAAQSDVIQKLLPLANASRPLFMGNPWTDRPSPDIPIVVPISVLPQPHVDPHVDPPHVDPHVDPPPHNDPPHVDPSPGGGGGGGDEHGGGGGGGGRHRQEIGQDDRMGEVPFQRERVSKDTDGSMYIIILLILACVVLFVVMHGRR